MSTESMSQFNLFIQFIMVGIIIGIIFDIFRIIRKCFSISDVHTYIEDILFGIITSLLLIYLLYIYNQGRVRLYMFIALSLGLIVYFNTISKYFIKIQVIIVSFIKKATKAIINIVLWPVQKIIEIFNNKINKHFKVFIINIKKIIDLKKYQKRQKKLHKKKDFRS